MANTFKFGNKNWAVKKDSVLAYNDENNNFKPLPFDFTRDSIGTYVDSDGLIKTAQKGIARIDYLDNTDGHLLLEPSRSNLITYSEDFSQSYWTKTNTTVTSGFESPDGTNNAFKLTSNNGGNIIARPSISSNTAHATSIYLKRVSGTGNVSIFKTNGNEEIVTLTYEWQRFTNVNLVNPSNAYAGVRFYGSDDEILMFGAQLEQGSYATSYIPTEGSSVTRAAESCIQTPLDGVIGQTEGTMYWEGKFQDAQNPILMQIVPSSANYLSSIYIEFNKATNSIRLNIYDSGVIQTTLTTSATPETKYKIALAYKQNDIQGYVNGVSIGSGTNATIQSGLNNLLIGGLVGYVNNNTFIGTKPNEVKLYNTRLTNAELEALTT